MVVLPIPKKKDAKSKTIHFFFKLKYRLIFVSIFASPSDDIHGNSFM